MKHISPFSQNRYEYEEQHFYFLPDGLFSLLETPTPTYLIGTRGTGKTTLLQSLNWRERIANESLRAAVGENPFGNYCVGVYVKLPRTQINLIDRWLRESEDEVYAVVLGTYLDLIALELIVDALSNLIDTRHLTCKPDHERTVLDEMTKSIVGKSAFTQGLHTGGLHTLGDLYQHLVEFRELLQQFAFTRSSVQEFMSTFPISQPGELTRKMTPFLARICDDQLRTDERVWHFKVLMDETEHLSERQQRVINSIVRLAEWPCLPVVSFVNAPRSETTLQGMSLQKADRQLIVIEEQLDDLHFREFVEGVASVRARRLIGDESLTFSCQRILGPLDINGLLESMLKKSVNPSARKLEQLASVLRTEARATSTGSSKNSVLVDDIETAAPPIYEAYLIERLSLTQPDATTESWERYRNASIEIRKRLVTAYLAICRDVLKRSPFYASARMLLQMSDKCIRDFLWQMDEVFCECGTDIVSFFNQSVSVPKQDAGMRRASINKQERVSNIVTRAPQQVLRIVEGLGEITAMVQSQGGRFPKLLTSERGVFRIPAPENNGENVDVPQLSELLIEAGNGGFLRLMSVGTDVWEFRVHASLAAAFGFSYRGAYANAICQLSWADLSRFRDGASIADRKVIAREIANRLIGEDLEQMRLFEEHVI